MKREILLKHLRTNGCYLKKEGKAHSLWCNTKTGQIESIPRHIDIPIKLAYKICQGLSVPEASS